MIKKPMRLVVPSPLATNDPIYGLYPASRSFDATMAKVAFWMDISNRGR